MAIKMDTKPTVIGLDFGNCNSFPCFISEFDSDTKIGGNVHDLLPGGMNDGIPSVFFYSDKTGVLCGENAVRSRARPVQNRKRYLKRHLGKTMTLDKREFSYDEAITEVIQHCVRLANRQLQSGWQLSTNLLSLAYPASYTFAQRQYLIEQAEKATLADGTPVKVYGTIAEPAAAALDYLAESGDSKEAAVLVYDLGGGTFDLALVAVYPQGRKNSEGDTYYYDIVDVGGLDDVGGAEFDEIMYQLLTKKFQVSLKPSHKEKLRAESERIKKDLSTDSYAEAELLYDDEYLSVQVTREEFEDASRELLQKTIAATKTMLADHSNQQPDYIVLTGGASQMPMIRKTMETEIPEFKEKIRDFRPNRAIAYGAARYGTTELISEIRTEENGSMIQRRTAYDLGIRFFHSKDDEKGYISTYIPAGTPIPYKTDFQSSHTLLEKQRYSMFRVNEAKTAHPNTENVSDDYTEIMRVQLDRGKEVPKGTKSETRLCIDKLGVLTIEAREADHPENKIQNNVELTNLSKS